MPAPQRGTILLTRNDPRAAYELKPGEIPCVPDTQGLLRHPCQADFDAAHKPIQAFWNGMLAKAAHIEVPEPRLQNVWRALLLQNFVLADGPRFTYGSGLMYNDESIKFQAPRRFLLRLRPKRDCPTRS